MYLSSGVIPYTRLSLNYSIRSHSHLFSSGYLRGRSQGLGVSGLSRGLIGVFMQLSFFYDLQRSYSILGSKSGTLAVSSRAFSSRLTTIRTKLCGGVEQMNSSSFYDLSTSTVKSGNLLLMLNGILWRLKRSSNYLSLAQWLCTQDGFYTSTWDGMNDYMNTTNFSQLRLMRASTVSYIINRTTVRNLFNLPKSQVILDVSFMLNQPFPTAAKFSFIILVSSYIQAPFKWYRT